LDDLAAQTPSNVTGTLVATVAGYHNDQAVTFDYSSGFVYRIANGGNVFQFDSLDDWIAGGPSTNVSIGSQPFSNGNLKRVNDASYDGATGGFYAVGAPAANSATPGDILIYDDLDAFRAAAHDSTLGDSPYNAARVMFWAPEAYEGMTVNSQDIVARYFQISSAGRLEGFKSLAAYAATPNNRINMTLEGDFGGTNTTGFQAIVAFAVPVPEPASFMFALSMAGCWIVCRRRH
jgi:hypothetical protein